MNLFATSAVRDSKPSFLSEKKKRFPVFTAAAIVSKNAFPLLESEEGAVGQALLLPTALHVHPHPAAPAANSSHVNLKHPFPAQLS